MPSFCAFNYSNCADKEKDKSNYRFSSIVKNNSKKGLKLESDKGKVVSSNFQERFNFERKLERTRIKIMLSASP